MREIKFRYIWERPKAWAGPYRPDDDKVKIVYVSLEDIEKGKSIKPLGYPDYNYSILVARNEYTGLKDKNGKEIYESDIVEQSIMYGKGIVFYSSEDARYRVYYENKKGEGSSTRLFGSKKSEVIGNIYYENPELLE